MAKKRTKRLTIAEQRECLVAAVRKRDAKEANRLRKDGKLTEFVARRQFAQYVAAGGDPADKQEFIKWLLDWLITNLPAIIALFTTI